MKVAIKTRVIVIARSLLIAGVVFGPLGVRPPGTALAQPLSPRAALERLMTAPHYRADWFAPGFRVNGVSYSPAQLELGRASTEAQFGPFAGLRPQPGGSYLLFYRTAVQRTSLTLDGQGRVAAWELGAPKLKVNRVDVGGYHLYIHCLGTGRPTVLLEAVVREPVRGMGPGPACGGPLYTRLCLRSGRLGRERRRSATADQGDHRCRAPHLAQPRGYHRPLCPGRPLSGRLPHASVRRPLPARGRRDGAGGCVTPGPDRA